MVSVVRNPLDAISHVNHIEVENQTERFVGQLEIGQELSFVDWEYVFDTLKFEDDPVLDHKVDTET